jgi:asparagine synthetase B (glutamine-hydrolysing)
MSSLTPLEIATGLVLGTMPKSAPRWQPTVEAREALERAVLPALRQAPCIVSFSGGRDSSAVLAVAAHVARREGLPLPIPATNVFPAVELSDEAEWQERVVSHLGLDEWLRLDHTHELDCVGSVATEVLSRHGLLWPFNAHFHAPLLRQASGGSLLTGVGGDELLLITNRNRWLELLRGRTHPEARDALRLGFALAPPPLRRWARARRVPLEFAWLRPEARRRFARQWADERVRQPRRWSDLVDWVGRLRYVQVGTASLATIADGERARVAHPFLDPAFGAAIAALPRSARFETRTQAMTHLFGDLLPEDVLERRTKASFDGAFWNEPSRAFVRNWDGSGLDADVVDVDALRTEWSKDSPDPRTYTLAQWLWLRTRGSSRHGLEQAFERVAG